MTDIIRHPARANQEPSGPPTPRVKYFRCPVCGQRPELCYYTFRGDPAGCDRCLESEYELEEYDDEEF